MSAEFPDNEPKSDQPSSNNAPPRKKPSRALVLWAIGIVVALAVFLVMPVEIIISRHAKPLVEPPPPQYTGANTTPADLLNFLSADFKIIYKVNDLPRPVLQMFTEPGTSRRTLADPGKKFLAGDVIYDSSLPRKRLIFAGEAPDRCFVSYEQGGIGLSHILVLFRLAPQNGMQPLWRGHCGGAPDLQGLREQIRNGRCS
jgi:hypothetical protein